MGGNGLDKEVTAVVHEWGDYIRAETLADDLVLEAPPASAHTEALDLDGQTITVGVVRRS